MICKSAQRAPFHCPTVEESIDATVALLPQGRAWPVNDGGGTLSRFRAWLSALAGAVPAAWPVGYVQAGFWSAIGTVRNYAERRLCDLRLEFWCATHVETHPEWMREYGLPDDCDPFPDLCTKVRALGGQRCEYFNEIIARLGWRAECYERSDACGAKAGCAQAGCAQTGNSRRLGLLIKVHTGEPNVQPSIERRYVPPRAGRMRAGQRPSCDTIEHPSIAPIRCLMDRIAPAHVEIQYVI